MVSGVSSRFSHHPILWTSERCAAWWNQVAFHLSCFQPLGPIWMTKRYRNVASHLETSTEYVYICVICVMWLHMYIYICNSLHLCMLLSKVACTRYCSKLTPHLCLQLEKSPKGWNSFSCCLMCEMIWKALQHILQKELVRHDAYVFWNVRPWDPSFSLEVWCSAKTQDCVRVFVAKEGVCLFGKRRRLSVHSALVIINLDCDQFQMIHGWNVCIRTGPWCLRLKAWNSSDVEHMGTLGAPLNKLKSLGPHLMAMPKYG